MGSDKEKLKKQKIKYKKLVDAINNRFYVANRKFIICIPYLGAKKAIPFEKEKLDKEILKVLRKK